MLTWNCTELFWDTLKVILHFGRFCKIAIQKALLILVPYTCDCQCPSYICSLWHRITYFQFLPICCKGNISLVFEFAFPWYLLTLNMIELDMFTDQLYFFSYELLIYKNKYNLPIYKLSLPGFSLRICLLLIDSWEFFIYNG